MTITSGRPLLGHLWKSVLITGILSVILGALMLAKPAATLLTAAIFFGAYLLVSGVSQVFHAFTQQISGGGVAEAASAISDEDTPGRWWMVFVGVVTVIGGIVLLAYPISSLATLMLVVGVWLVVIGIFEIIAAFGIRKTGKEVRTAVGDALGAR